MTKATVDLVASCGKLPLAPKEGFKHRQVNDLVQPPKVLNVADHKRAQLEVGATSTADLRDACALAQSKDATSTSNFNLSVLVEQ